MEFTRALAGDAQAVQSGHERCRRQKNIWQMPIIASVRRRRHATKTSGRSI